MTDFFTERGYEKNREFDLSPCMEDYLEMIYRLSRPEGYTRAKKIADNLNVSAASVTKMIKKLSEKNYLHYEKYGVIRLTSKGYKVGEYLLKRHNFLEEFLTTLGAKGNLQKQVERIEHHISYDSFQILACFLKFLQQNPHIISEFHKYKNQ